MDEAAHGGWRTNATRAPWPKLVGRSLAGGLAFILSARAFGADAGEATTGGIAGFVALLAVQTWLVLRHGPDAAGDHLDENEEPKDDYRPPLFGNE